MTRRSKRGVNITAIQYAYATVDVPITLLLQLHTHESTVIGYSLGVGVHPAMKAWMP
jgi:hypothetical protein